LGIFHVKELWIVSTLGTTSHGFSSLFRVAPNTLGTFGGVSWVNIEIKLPISPEWDYNLPSGKLT